MLSWMRAGAIAGLVALASASPAVAEETRAPATVEAVFSQDQTNQYVLDIEAAMARAQAAHGAIPQAAADAMGAHTGDTITIVNRLDAGKRVDVAITGTWRADPADPFWLADPLVIDGAQTSGRFTTRGPLVVAAADLTSGPLAEPLVAEWRAIPDVNGFRPEALDAVAAQVRGLAGRVNAALPGSNQATTATKLPDISPSPGPFGTGSDSPVSSDSSISSPSLATISASATT